MKYYLKLTILIETIFTLICSVSLAGAIVYRLYSLNLLGVICSLILGLAIFFGIQFSRPKAKEESAKLFSNNYKTEKNWDYNSLIIQIFYSIALFTSFLILYNNQNADAIISPWQKIPWYFFLYYSFTALSLLGTALKPISRLITLINISIFYFLSFSVALIIYKLGYGYDPHIHRATMELIDKIGAVDPKPFYYLGQYSLVIIIHKLTFISIAWLDKLLVPFLAAIYLPFYLWELMKKRFLPLLSQNKTTLNILVNKINDKKFFSIAYFFIIFALIFPFSYFIVTTPQNLAYLLIIIIIIKGINCRCLYDLNFIYLLALTAFFVQPIAGLPALLFSLWLTVYHSDQGRVKKFQYILIFIATIIILPLAFYFSEHAISDLNGFNWRALNLVWPQLTIPGEENFILNFLYLYGFNLKFIFLCFTLIGFVIAYKNKANWHELSIYFYISLALFLSYFLTKVLPFNFLINYERDNFPDRVLILSAFFLLPFVWLAIYKLIEKVWEQDKITRSIILSASIFLLLASLYFSYPRFDHYFNTRGYSIGQNDFLAALWINNDAGANKDYIVLANQQTSAAALTKYGFKKYYKSNIFYYPIPTSSPLYQSYLSMVYDYPSRDNMKNAMDLTGVNIGYFVLDKYWWAFPKILEEAKLEANSFKEIGKGDIYIFKYTR